MPDLEELIKNHLRKKGLTEEQIATIKEAGEKLGERMSKELIEGNPTRKEIPVGIFNPID